MDKLLTDPMIVRENVDTSLNELQAIWVELATVSSDGLRDPESRMAVEFLYKWLDYYGKTQDVIVLRQRFTDRYAAETSLMVNVHSVARMWCHFPKFPVHGVTVVELYYNIRHIFGYNIRNAFGCSVRSLGHIGDHV